METAGYVIVDRDHSAIWAAENTEAAAWAALRFEMGMAGVAVVDGASDAPHETSISNFLIFPATAALIERVENMGGNIAWGAVNGVLCTREGEGEPK